MQCGPKIGSMFHRLSMLVDIHTSFDRFGAVGATAFPNEIRNIEREREILTMVCICCNKQRAHISD